MQNLKRYDYKAVLFARILNMNRRFLHTRSFRCIQPSVLRYTSIIKGLSGPANYPGFSIYVPLSSVLSGIVVHVNYKQNVL